MNYKDWTTLKTAGKVAFKKIEAVDEVKDSDGNTTTHSQQAYTVLEKKVYDINTGAESTVQEKMFLSELEQAKAEKTAEKEALTTELTELDKMITEIKAV